MKVLDLFSGIGGFSLGLERAGMETVAFCEIDPYCRTIIKKHWPDILIHEDIQDLDGNIYRNKIDLLCGGLPCQPFSVAGKQRGKEDPRHLWPQMLRVIKQAQPAWIIIENVTGFITLSLDTVLHDLEAENYASQPFVIPACAVGGIHRRARLFIVSYAEHFRRDRTQIETSNGKTIPDAKERPDQALQPEGVCIQRTMANADATGLEGFPRNEQNAGKGQNTAGSIAPQNISHDWQPLRLPTEPPLRYRDDGLSDNVARLKALGNSVVPQIPQLIGEAIMNFDQ